MSMVILIAVAAVIAALVFAKLRKSPESKPAAVRKQGGRGAPAAPGKAAKPAATPETDKFRGVTLFPQKEACEAIMKLRGKTYGPDRIPRLPVPGCGREKCDCQLHEVVGRRRGPRRIHGDRRDDVRFKEDRRNGKDRREGVETWNQSVD